MRICVHAFPCWAFSHSTLLKHWWLLFHCKSIPVIVANEMIVLTRPYKPFNPQATKCPEGARCDVIWTVRSPSARRAIKLIRKVATAWGRILSPQKGPSYTTSKCELYCMSCSGFWIICTACLLVALDENLHDNRNVFGDGNTAVFSFDKGRQQRRRRGLSASVGRSVGLTLLLSIGLGRRWTDLRARGAEVLCED